MNSKTQHQLEYLFHPRSVAVVGAAPGDISKAGFGYFAGIAGMGVLRKLYPVNLTGETLLGYPGFKSVRDIPEPVDYVIFAVPARVVPGVMEDCVERGVRFVHMFTAGMSETGEAEDSRLQTEILNIAHRGGIRVLGPNCMGIYSPPAGLTFYPGLSHQSGPVAFLSQSGGLCEDLIRMGDAQDVHFSRMTSFGNASDINESELLEYYTRDDESSIIGLYLEGVRDGRRFARALKEAAQRKPVVFLKGGRTEAGKRAANSHTGSLAGSAEAWAALGRQAGVIPVYGLSELLDVLMTLRFLPAPRGFNTALIGEGGGISVLASDDCIGAGLSLPPVPEDMRRELRRLIPKAGTSTRNPVDSPISVQSPADFQSIIKLVAGYGLVDSLIVHISVDWTMLLPDGKGRLDQMITALIEVGKTCGKPVAVAVLTAGAPPNWAVAYELQKRCLAAGFPVFPNIARAARAISKVVQYRQSRH
ncbi:MAG: CoA-binding protein [Dehalococcoidales bacterium]|nr:CoA-binding protein [Dehalococcoidales bacterium]